LTLTVTVNGGLPVSGVAVSQPCGVESACTVTVAPPAEVGAVTCTGLAAGNVASFTW
jgi:hypothetical protein